MESEVTHLRLRASGGNAEAQVRLGIDLLNANGDADAHREAYSWFSRAAARGNQVGMYYQAYCLVHGVGVKTNLPAAIALLESCARAASPYAPAMTLLAGQLLTVGTTDDHQRAVRLAERALVLGDHEANMPLARAYALGRGVDANLRVAYAHAADAVLKVGTDEARRVFNQLSQRVKATGAAH